MSLLLVLLDMSGALYGVIFAIVGLVIIAAVIAGFFMWIGAKMAGVENATFGKSIWTAVVSGIVSGVLSLLFSIIPVIGTLVGYLLGILFSIIIIKNMFNTTGGKAFMVWVFNIVAQVIAIFIALMTFASSLQGVL